MSFSKIFQILFIVGSSFLFFFVPEYLNNSWWFSSSFSTFEDRRRISIKSCSILFKIHSSSLMPSSHNCFRLWEFFSPIRSNSGAFSVWFSVAHHLRIIHSSFQLSFWNSSDASFKYSLISSWSIRSLVSKFSQASSFIFQFFLVMRSFFVRSFNPYSRSSNIPLSLLSYQFIRSFEILPVDRWRPFSS